MAVSASVAKQSQHINLLLLMLLNVLAFSAPSAVASANDHRFNVGEHVPIFVNKVGPFNNPRYHLPIQHPDSTSFGSISPIACTQFVYQNVQYIPPQSMLMNDLLPCDLFTSRRPFNALETYQYYDIPFCRPEPVIQKQESIGEVLNGDRLTNTLYKLNFREEKALETLCQKKLNVAEIAKFRDAVINDFYFQMYYDDLPMWAFIGRVEDESWTLRENGPKYYLFKHVQFDVLYKGNQVIEIQAFSDPNHVLDITEDVETDVKFTYSVNWSETSVSFDSRMNKYAKASLLPIRQKIHWFSFINSIVIIVLLMGLLTLLIMQRLKNDLRKSSNGDEEEDKEVGWKYIHGDVFRYPSNLSLFCAVLGTGTQLLTLVCILFLLAFFGVLYPYNRGALFTSLVLVYTITSVVAGYTAAAFHNQFSETRWVRSVLLTGTLYLGPLLVTVFIVNMVAVAYGATAALPFGTFVVILLIYMFIAIPLLALGGLIGYRFRSEFQAPCATKQYPREIPPLAWYRKTPCQMFIGGLLPFSAILIQLHHLYASIWGYKIYTLPGILFITFVILVVLTAILSVGLTYIQLSVEDHKWWWRSMLSGGSTAIFTFGYGIYLYLRSNMKGFMQLFSFIGYTACMSYAIFLMLATISFHASLMFVRYIYRAVKSE